MKHVLAWLVWWLAFSGLWLLLVGRWNREQVVAAAIAGAVAGAAAEFGRSRTGFSAPLPLCVLAAAPSALGMVVVDFGILAWALLASLGRRRIVRGQIVERKLPRERTWTVLFATLSPNAYVVDLDLRRSRVLLHDLVPYRKSESPL
ncbi:MAG TPA: hypothetical protein VFV91_09490 [Gaiellaceae bacterium]|nr:hypothetical protein [Gaiellaceae bacterium]